MSLILDAMRQSAAAREQGKVPRIDQPAPPLAATAVAAAAPEGPASVTRAATWPRTLWAGVLVLAVLVGLGLGLLASRPAPEAAAPAPQPKPTETDAPVAQAPARPAPVQTPAPPVPNTKTADGLNDFQRIPISPPRQSEAPDGRASVTPIKAPSAAVLPLARQPSASPNLPTTMPRHSDPTIEALRPPAAPAAHADGASAPRLQDLPQDLQQSVPNLRFGGAMVSSDSSSRLLIINGQLLREGDNVTPDLRLEAIRHKSAVLNHRGTRFEVNY
jgi:general secretion pathway protein B